MVRLTREVRLNLTPDGRLPAGGSGHSGVGAADGAFVHWTVGVTVAGEPDGRSGYLLDIKAVDDAVKREAMAVLAAAVRARTPLPGVVGELFGRLRDAWPGRACAGVWLACSPFHRVEVRGEEADVVRLKHRFEFSAAHRLHNADLSDAENVGLFGKCNNAAGHGHNYEVEVCVAGRPGEDGRLIAVADLERLVDEHAIKKVDHKHLNVQVPEFRELNPSVEHIARVIYGWLRPHLGGGETRLEAVTVWETPKTSCEYREG